MKLLRLILIVQCFLLGVGMGCASLDQEHQNVPQHPFPVMDLRDPSLAQYAPFWQTDIARRFPNSVIILCHGGHVIRGEWIIQTNPGGGYGDTCELVGDVLRKERAEYPEKTIVLLACNTDSIVLHGFPNVYYSLAETWCLPDRAIGELSEQDAFTTMDGHRYRTIFDSEEDGPMPLSVENRWVSAPDVTGNVYELVSAS